MKRARPYRRKWTPNPADERPTLAETLKAARTKSGLDWMALAKAAGVPYAAARDAELSHPVLAPEAAQLAAWCGMGITCLQAPPAATHRLVGRSAPIADPRLATAILAHVAQGQPLGRFKYPGMELTPSQIYGRVTAWLNKDSKFKEAYMKAKETAALMYGEQIIEIAADVTDPEDIQVAQFQIDIKQRMAKIFNKAVFADSIKQAQQQPLALSFGDALERLNSAKRQAPEQLSAPAQTLHVIDVEPESEGVSVSDED